jgi:hypothetical protein
MVKGEDQQQQHPLQAVVIADAAELRFRPITLEMPRVSFRFPVIKRHHINISAYYHWLMYR